MGKRCDPDRLQAFIDMLLAYQGGSRIERAGIKTSDGTTTEEPWRACHHISLDLSDPPFIQYKYRAV